MSTINDVINKSIELKEARDRRDTLVRQRDEINAQRTDVLAKLQVEQALIDTLKAELKALAAELV